MRGVKMHCLNFAAFVMALMLSYLDSTTANSAPKITLAPSPHRVMEDGTVSFFCRASGKPTPTFTWKRDGKRIRPKATRHWIEIHDQTPHISALRIREASAKKDNATFTCLATNDLGEARSDARLYVYPKLDDYPTGYPTIENHLKLRAVEKNRNVLLKCDTKGDPKPRVQWLKDSLPVDVNNDPRIQVLESGYLQIRNSQESDQGTYECVAENKWGVAYSYRAMIYVRSRRIAPKFSKVPYDQRVAPGSDVNLTCIAYGSPRPFVRWSQGANYLTEDDYVPVGLNVLILNDVRQSKNYTCEASSGLGKINHTVQVIVQAAPGSPPENVMASAASTTAVLVSWDPPKIPNGVIKGYKVFYTTKPAEPIFSWEYQVVNSDNRVTTISGLKANVTYAISVLAFSSVGQGPMSYPIQVLTTQGAPGSPPENVMASAASATTVLVSWDTPKIPNGVIKGYKVFYTTKPAEPIFSWEYQVVNSDNRVTTISGLKANVTYAISLLAFSSVGQGPMSYPIQVLTTQGAAPGSPPENVMASAASTTAVLVSWDPPKIPNGVIKGYKVFYTTKPAEPIFSWEYQVVNSDNRVTTISGLKANVTYAISVLAFSSVGQGPMSYPIQVLTTQGVPYQPINLVAEAISANVILVKWNPPQEAEQIMSYQLYFNDSYTRQNGHVSIDPPIPSYRLVDLIPDTTYHIQVSARSQKGEGPKTPTVQVHTPQFVPGVPRHVRLQALNSTGFFVEWDAPNVNEQNGIIRGYQVHYIEVDAKDKPIPGIPEKRYDTFDPKKKEAVITGLKPDSFYLVQVSAYTKKGDGLRSRQRVILTKGAVPSAPRNLWLDLTQDDPPNVKVTWMRPVETHGDIHNYKIIWGPQGGLHEENVLHPDIYSYFTPVLDKGTTYEFRVSARNDVDYGQRSVKSVTTPDGPPSGAPQNFTATGLTETAVRLTWDLPARKLRNGDILMYQITYRKMSEGIYEEDLNSTDTFSDLVGLEINTDYFFKIKAYTSKGSGPWSNRLHFRTLGRIPPPPPKNVVARRTSSNSISVMWDEPSMPVSGYKIFYNKFATPSMAAWMREEIGPYAVAEINNLEPKTTYAVRVQAKSVGGRYGNLSAIVTTSLDDEKVPGVPRHVRLQALNSTGFFVEWDAPNVNEQNGIIRGYQVHYIEVDAKDKPIPGIPEKRYDTFDPKKKEAVITGLKPDSFYLVQVSAYTKKGDGLRSRQRVILTKGAVPSAPRNLWLDLTQDDPPNVKVTWMRPVETHGDIHNYKIIWGPQGGLYEENVLHPDIYSYFTPVLDKGTTYEFRVSARNDVDYGQRSVKSVTTPDGPPSGAPQNFTATDLTETAVRLTWDLPARKLRNGDILMYQITYRKMSESIYEEDLNSTDTFSDLVGLEINTDYFFKIKAYTSKGSGPWSNRLNFRTLGRIPPPPPKNVVARRTSSNSISVMWDEPSMPVSGYKIFYNKFATPSMAAWMQEEIGPYAVAEINNLEPKTTYAVRVQAKSVGGRYGNLSAIVTTSLDDEKVPPKVDAPEVLTIEQGNVLLKLNKASEFNGVISHYHFVVVPKKASGVNKMPSDYTVDEVWYFLFPQTLKDGEDHEDRKYKTLKMKKNFLSPWFPKLLGNNKNE